MVDMSFEANIIEVNY